MLQIIQKKKANFNELTNKLNEEENEENRKLRVSMLNAIDNQKKEIKINSSTWKDIIQNKVKEAKKESEVINSGFYLAFDGPEETYPEPIVKK